MKEASAASLLLSVSYMTCVKMKLFAVIRFSKVLWTARRSYSYLLCRSSVELNAIYFLHLWNIIARGNKNDGNILLSTDKRVSFFERDGRRYVVLFHQRAKSNHPYRKSLEHREKQPHLSLPIDITIHPYVVKTRGEEHDSLLTTHMYYFVLN